MGALFALLFFAALAIATGGWGFGIVAIVFLAYLLAREIRSAHVFDDVETPSISRIGRHGP